MNMKMIHVLCLFSDLRQRSSIVYLQKRGVERTDGTYGQPVFMTTRNIEIWRSRYAYVHPYVYI